MSNNLKSQRGKISSSQLFFVLFVSRIVVTLTYVQTVSVGKLSSDFLFSIALSFVFTMLLSVPIILCLKSNRESVIPIAYSLYFIWLSAINISRFSYFASSRISVNSSMIFFIIAIVASACYCAIMGVEGISRFGSICGVILLITVTVVLIFNVHNLNMINYYPVETNSKMDVVKNALVMTSNSAEPAVLLIMSDKINGSKFKPLLASIGASYLTVFLLILFVVGIMGASATLQAYPIFSLFQMASVGSFSRLDMLHTAFWVLALLLKISVLIYATSLTTKGLTHVKKCVFISGLVAVASILVVVVFGTAIVQITKYVSIASFAVFVVILPIITLFVRRKTNEKA